MTSKEWRKRDTVIAGCSLGNFNEIIADLAACEKERDGYTALLAQCEEALPAIRLTLVRGHCAIDVVTVVDKIASPLLTAIRAAREGT